MLALPIRLATIYWSPAVGGELGAWACNVIDADGEHTSDLLEIGASNPDDGSESEGDVIAAFRRCWPALTGLTWRADGDGLEGRP